MAGEPTPRVRCLCLSCGPLSIWGGLRPCRPWPPCPCSLTSSCLAARSSRQKGPSSSTFCFLPPPCCVATRSSRCLACSAAFWLSCCACSWRRSRSWLSSSACRCSSCTAACSARSATAASAAASPRSPPSGLSSCTTRTQPGVSGEGEAPSNWFGRGEPTHHHGPPGRLQSLPLLSLLAAVDFPGLPPLRLST
jgi:hypothetical protein